jgi:hypothetical protein
MNTPTILSSTSDIEKDPYYQEIKRAGYMPTPALIAEVQRLHQAALNEALVTRAFAAVRAANRRRGAVS